MELAVGQAVEARFGGKARWYPGAVKGLNDDGTLAIDYEECAAAVEPGDPFFSPACLERSAEA